MGRAVSALVALEAGILALPGQYLMFPIVPGGDAVQVIGRLLIVQLLVALVIGAAAAGQSWPAAYSAWLGAFSCWLPNVLFAWRLWAQKRRQHTVLQSGVLLAAPAPSSGVHFFLGELIKLAATVLLLFASVRLFPAMVWWAFFAGIVVVLKSYLLLLVWR
ncbi:hypothetical protein DU000_11955 [Parvibium lacunae]|uniref:ATP synthase subunit I n=1 Tax=Parvibium lacunae TaxID=1888893 RepID=A0A368KZW6_9BURK|nr:hypothetical protein DU000_11955 [Parvibium lacunae]